MVSKSYTFIAGAWLLSATLAAIATSAMAQDPMAGESDMVRQSRAMSAELGGKLKAQLEAALKSGGPASALGVCQTVAPAIGGELSQSFGGEVGRTALKVRNTDNAPDAFEAKILERFVAEAANGADLTKLEHSETVEENGKRLFRYMKAIPMAEKPCAACHGKTIDPPLLDKIRELYPEDQATGFVPGEVRGAFTITKQLP